MVPKKPAAAAKPKAAPKKTQALPKTAKVAPKKRAKPDSDVENSDHDIGGRASADDASLLSQTPPSAKKQKKGPGPKMSSGKHLQPISNESYGAEGADDVKSKKKLTATEQYQKVRYAEVLQMVPN